MIFAVKFKRYIADTFIFTITECKFHYRYKLCPVILFLIDKQSKISFYHIFFVFPSSYLFWDKK